jgi:hypothetical protein
MDDQFAAAGRPKVTTGMCNVALVSTGARMAMGMATI